MEKVKLKPCPFCGKTYRGKYICGPTPERFECPSCGAKGPFPDLSQWRDWMKPSSAARLTVAAWNRRAQDV